MKFDKDGKPFSTKKAGCHKAVLPLALFFSSKSSLNLTLSHALAANSQPLFKAQHLAI